MMRIPIFLLFFLSICIKSYIIDNALILGGELNYPQQSVVHRNVYISEDSKALLGSRRNSAVCQLFNGVEVIIIGGEMYNGGSKTALFSNSIWVYHNVKNQIKFVGGSNVDSEYGYSASSLDVYHESNHFGSHYGSIAMQSLSLEECIIFGGFGFNFDYSRGLLNDLWSVNETTFFIRHISGSKTSNSPSSYLFFQEYDQENEPSGRLGHSSLIFSGSNHVILMFGEEYLSQTKFKYLNDVWIFSISRNMWQILSSNSSGVNEFSYPSQRIGASMWEIFSYSKVSKVGFFGGSNESCSYNDVWSANISEGVSPKFKRLSSPSYCNVHGDSSSGVIGSRSFASVLRASEEQTLIMFGLGFSLNSEYGMLSDAFMITLSYDDASDFYETYFVGGKASANYFHGYSDLGEMGSRNWPPARSGASLWFYNEMIFTFGGNCRNDASENISCLLSDFIVFSNYLVDPEYYSGLAVSLSVCAFSFFIISVFFVFLSFFIFFCSNEKKKKPVLNDGSSNKEREVKTNIQNPTEKTALVSTNSLKKRKYDSDFEEDEDEDPLIQSELRNFSKNDDRKKKIIKIKIILRSFAASFFTCVVGIVFLTCGLGDILIGDTFRSKVWFFFVQDVWFCVCGVISLHFMIIYNIMALQSVCGFCNKVSIIPKTLKIGRRTTLQVVTLFIIFSLVQFLFCFAGLGSLGERCSFSEFIFPTCHYSDALEWSLVFFGIGSVSHNNTFRVFGLLFNDGLLVLSLIIYWIDFFRSTTISFIFSNRSIMKEKDFIHSQRVLPPISYYTVQCYHWENCLRELQSNVDGNINIENEQYQEKVVTHFSSMPFKFKTFVDVSGDLIKPKNILGKQWIKINVDKKIIFDCEGTQEKFRKEGESFKDQNSSKDSLCDFQTHLDIPSAKSKFLVSSNENRFFFTSFFFYFLFSLFGMQILYRYLLDSQIGEVNYTLTKMISASDSIEYIDKSVDSRYILKPNWDEELIFLIPPPKSNNEEMIDLKKETKI